MNREPEQPPIPDDPLPRIILFLKAPWPGRVKTRLASELGNKAAVAIYRELVERQVAALPAGWPVEIRFDPAEARDEMISWLGAQFRFRSQAPGDLGQRMSEAVRQAFSEGETTVLCVGADCPDLGPEEFAQARNDLGDGADLVFGPARDGGYYLLGLRHHCPEIFDRIRWSSPQTLDVSLQRAREAGRIVTLLTEKSDIDFAEDWARHRRHPLA